MYQKEFENIITLICNKHTPQRLVQHVLTEAGLLSTLIQKQLNSSFEFTSGRKQQTGFFATFCEVSSIVNDSENEYVREETAKEEKWRNFCYLYIEPIKQRFKDGLLTPPPVNNSTTQNNNDFSNFDCNDKMDEQSTDNSNLEKVEESQKKSSIQDFLNQLTSDFSVGRRQIEDTRVEVDPQIKKDEMEILNDEEEDHYNYTSNEAHSNHMLYGSEKLQSENHEFYDNNYWALSLKVDELDLQELTQSL